MVFPSRFNYFPSKNRREFEFFMIAREISKSDFLIYFCKRQRKITLWSRNRSYSITFNQNMICLSAATWESDHFSSTFLHLLRGFPLLSICPVPTIWLKEDSTSSNDIKLSKNENCQFSKTTACRCSPSQGFLNFSAELTEIQMCRSLFFNNIASLNPSVLLKKRLWHSCFLVNFLKLFGTTFLQTQN